MSVAAERSEIKYDHYNLPNYKETLQQLYNFIMLRHVKILMQRLFVVGVMVRLCLPK